MRRPAAAYAQHQVTGVTTATVHLVPAREFAAKWGRASLKEHQAVQEHFIDLCRLIGHPTPAEDDPDGQRFTFEMGAAKSGGGQGWADVWKKDCFAWEYKGKHADPIGYAAPRIADDLKRKGGDLVTPPEGFIVDGREGPLKQGELERAANWAKEELSHAFP